MDKQYGDTRKTLLSRYQLPQGFRYLCHLLETLSPVLSKRLSAFLAARAHFWLMFNLVFFRTPRAFSAQLLSNPLASTLYWRLRLFLSMGRTLHFP